MAKNWKEYAADFAVNTTSGIVVGVIVGVAVTAITSNPAFGIMAGKVTAGGVFGGSMIS
ncbi:hypothetical protein ACN23B_23485 [Anabaena sp. FACHB-709]|uniref:Uncharacterized protein n=2 Tax=Nostocaceae TaxID=1162 RepID=A0A1Z4KMX2_ANAVA|nr:MULTISPECIES: hypothetical protein [Nostocaceae]BAY70288.1 hypothetical protein NIES23_30920 [Trichormus variabilis NIES-23]MBD2173457.1 hypothetical protein [Anabaena cylindrica FACHB-318]MBD2265234.1 hypothetical protein [Anabaena sp. FACHB-709]MBD2274518.1 hypothetical protein [Nostoc sp. PCC 7120 = FACHB-418]MBD2285449.1 hypothetical protein [Anabaena cylindrica FACHB-170]